MTSWGRAEYEIPNNFRRGIAIIGRDPGAEEVRQNRPFVGTAGRILEDAMAEAGIRRGDVAILNVSRERPPGNKFEAHSRASLEREVSHLHDTLDRLKPRVIVTLGNEAAHAVVPDWPDARNRDGLYHRGSIKGARDIENRRGYIFESRWGAVVTTVHPAAVARTWTPWRTLLSYDLQRAKEIYRDGLVRPTREVEIVGSDRDARRAVGALRRFGILGADIETWGDSSLACIGFAGESGKAVVFPAEHLDRASSLLRAPDVTTVWANGIYDLFVLKHRYGVEFRARVEDVQIAWHAAYAELAGAKEDKKKHRFTRKSLAFLASLFTYDEWWKGDYVTTEEFFIYNGKDCCITLDVWRGVMEEVRKVGAEAVYEHERSLMWPCVDMLARGLNVDEALRLERVAALEAALKETHEVANAAALPLIEREAEALEALGTIHLFQETDKTCECCGHGTKKQERCWGCVGFEKAPTKQEMAEKFGIEVKSMSKAAMEERFLPVCHKCCGAPRETRFVANLNSETQMKTLLYDVLKAPKRFKRNQKGESVLTVDEAALKSIRGAIA